MGVEEADGTAPRSLLRARRSSRSRRHPAANALPTNSSTSSSDILDDAADDANDDSSAAEGRWGRPEEDEEEGGGGRGARKPQWLRSCHDDDDGLDDARR